MNNQSFFDFIYNDLIKKAHLDTAMEETSDFLTASAENAESNSNNLSDINLLKNDLILLQARLNHWHQTQAHTDSRTVNTEIKKLYHDFIEFMKRMESVPEINYKEFGHRLVKEPIGTPPELNPKYAKWLLAIVIPFILSVFSFLAWNAYQAFYPKSDEKIDNNRCWVTTDWTFAKLMSEPSFMPKDIITDLPGTKTYHVLDVVTVRSGIKCYKIEDKKLKVTGWVQASSLAEVNDVCFKNPPSSQPIDETACYLTAGWHSMVQANPQFGAEAKTQLSEGRKYKILDKKVFNQGVLNMTFYKVDDGNGLIGWVEHKPEMNISAKCL